MVMSLLAYLLTKRDFDGARDSLSQLRGHPYIETELSEIQETLDRNLGRKVNFVDLAKPQNLKPLLIRYFSVLCKEDR
jgi:hypothetical protein